MPDGRSEEFDKDTSFPLHDLSSASPHSADDVLFTYADADINCTSNGHFSHPFLGTYEVHQFLDLGYLEGTHTIPHSYQYHGIENPYHTPLIPIPCHTPYHVTLCHTI